MKQLVEFREEKEGEAVLEIAAFALSSEEHKEALEELNVENVHYERIDADSLNALVSGPYEVVMQKCDRLVKKGWRWNEEE